MTWRANPPLPGAVDDSITVTEATFQIDHLEVVGDAGVDERTTRSNYLLVWDSDRKPAQESFPQAPVGVYSRINLVMSVGSLSENIYEIRGTWTDNGVTKPFRIRDRGQPLSARVDCQATLPAAGSAKVALRLDLADAVSNINFRLLDDGSGEIELSDGAQLLGFRARLRQAFEVEEED